ncbi:hypothetical protein L207DRAFT_591981 [Hyaloscypha variabilis F]|uniref:Zn(2)-C6 fungal-type domain-containing protein n=1 Tax=Hyaloscypha variabilis (strain UAMH 11265 / GT02V1 / F) TaxID=1149755 RepID=A0A2J6QXP3_HYAVF|nr:hypothetical protein L207DRAFT_591981 [Hyaloscypha variabilis F]
MPRLAARSNRCITCKRRKVKCDESKPSCERCKKAYMDCEGYRNPGSMIWVSQNSQFQQLRGSGSVLDVSSESSTSSNSLAMANFYPADFLRVMRTPSPMIDISAKSEDMWICYLSTELLPGTNYSNIGMPVKNSWILDLLEWDCESVAYYTVCCLSSAFWARMHNVTQTISKVSGNYYMKALRQLSNNLSRDSTRLHPTNVASAFLLGIYELTMFEHGYGWLQHAGGITRSLMMGKRTFLEEPEWQAISSTIESPRVRSMYRLMDMMAKIPGLLEDSDAVRKAARGCPSPYCRSRGVQHSSMEINGGTDSASRAVTDNDSEEASHVDELGVGTQAKMVETRRKTVLLLSELFEWRFQFHELNPQLAFEMLVDPATSQTLTDDDLPLFETVIRYRDYHRGRELVMYNTALLIIFYLLHSWSVEEGVAQALDVLLTSPSSDYSSERHQTCLILPHHNIKSSDVSTELVRSIEYFLEGRRKMHGAMSMILPIRILMDSLESNSYERSFVCKVMNRMGVGQGFGFVQQIQRHMRFKGDLNLCSSSFRKTLKPVDYAARQSLAILYGKHCAPNELPDNYERDCAEGEIPRVTV